MAEKLAAYRAKKEREKTKENSFIGKAKRTLLSVSKLVTDRKQPHAPEEIQGKTTDLHSSASGVELHHRPLQSTPVTQEEDSIPLETLTEEVKPVWVYRSLLTLKVLLWLCGWGVFLELGFAAVYFTVSLLIFVYFNTRTGPRDDKLSAYSVFNKNQEKIQGTLTAEEMQRQMFRLPGLPG